jgi:hypothetical protein
MNARLALGGVGLFMLALLLLHGGSRADCGPGPLVTMQSKGIVQQLLAFSTNGTFLPTYAIGITVGTSGCSHSGVVEADRAATEFVAWNADGVARDMAQGRGPYVASMAALLGCPAALHADFARFAQRHFAALAPAAQPSPAQWVAQVRAGLAGDAGLAGRCSSAS